MNRTLNDKQRTLGNSTIKQKTIIMNIGEIMENVKEKLLTSVITGKFSDEVLSDALAILQGKTLSPEETPVGFMSEKEARKYCGNVSRSTFWHWQKQGLRSYLVRGRRLFLADDLRAFVLGYQNTPAETVATAENRGER
jgi:hypothetical protein